MQLLQDVFIIEQLQVLTEGKASDTMKIKGVFGRCNEKNNNGRVYPTKVLEGQLAKVQPLISERRLCGELDHPSNDTVKLSNASHLITKLEMKGNELIGEAEVLKTPAGLTAQALINGGVKIGISSRGMGTLSEDHATGNKVVNEDFRLVTFDLVADPSTRGAYPGLSESTESQFVRESQDKLGKEGNFLTLLGSRMRKAYKPYIEEAVALKPGQTEAGRLSLHKHRAAQAKLSPEQRAKRAANKPAMEEALDMIRRDGHWHRIAEALADALNEDLASNIMAQKPEDEGIGLAASERRRGMRGHQKKQLRMTQKHQKKMGRIETAQSVRHTKKTSKAEGKAGITKAKYGGKAAKYDAKTAVTRGTGEGAGIAAKARGQADATRTAGQAKGDANALQAKGDARAGVTKAQGGVDAKRTTDVGGAKTKGKEERQTGREALKTSAQKAAIAAPGKAAAGLKKGAEATIDTVAKNLPGAARKAGEITGKAGRGLAAGARKAGEAIAQRRSTPQSNAKPAAAGQTRSERGGLGDTSKVNPNLKNRAASLKTPGKNVAENPAIAGPKGKLPGQRKNEWTSYKQIGLVLAEALGWTLTEAQAMHTQSKDQSSATQKVMARGQAALPAHKKFGAGQSKEQKTTATTNMGRAQTNTGRKL